jgi:hypothetical protein
LEGELQRNEEHPPGNSRHQNQKCDCRLPPLKAEDELGYPPHNNKAETQKDWGPHNYKNRELKKRNDPIVD